VRINLLPPEIYERQRLRRRTAVVIAIGIILLAGVGAFYFLQVLRLNAVEDDVAQQEAENAQLQQEISELQEIAELQAEIESTRTLLSSLLSDRVLWSGILRDISLVIPGEAWLEGLTGTLTAAVPGTTEAPTVEATAQPAGLVGQISFTGFAFDHRDVALWLSRLEDVRGFVNPWLSTSAKAPIGETEVVQFSSSVDLSEQALARRGTGGGGAGGGGGP
jgi:Tfp pilus assembly protein PilN